MSVPTIEQLEAALVGIAPKAPIMPDGVRRWIPAAVPMREDDSPVGEQFIADLAACINAEGVSIPIDGGADGSVTHVTAADDATGWAHRAVVIDGGLYLEAEVLPEVDARIERGRLVYSSIDALYDIDAEGAYVAGSARLITHGLTNTPRNRNVPAMQALHAHQRIAHSFTRARLAQGDSMMKKSEKAAEKPAEAKAEVKAAETQAEAEIETNAEETKAAEMTLEEALAKIAELEAKLEAMTAGAEEMSARLADQPTEAEVAEKAAIAMVDKAIEEGRISSASRDRFVAIAKRNAEAAKATFAMLPARTRRVTQAETKAATDDVGDLTETERVVERNLRAAGMTEKQIKASIRARRAATEV